MPYLLGTRCGSPHQSQRKLQPAPGPTCQSAQSDPGGQSAPPKKKHYSVVLRGRERKQGLKIQRLKGSSRFGPTVQKKSKPFKRSRGSGTDCEH